MPDKKQILKSIALIARKLNRAPSRSEFIAGSGISLYFVLRSFPKWSDAVRAAGLQPYTLNLRVQDRALLEDWGKAARRCRPTLRNRGRLPRHVYQREGKYHTCTLAKRFGGWYSVAPAFQNFAKGKREWTDVLALLPAHDVGASFSASPASHRTSPAHSKNRFPAQRPPSSAANKPRHAPLEDRTMYGNPLDFRGLRHEPVNEQGVVLLFGMLAKELGYLVEAVQTGFPDCEAKRKIAPERWQRVRIEFEFESRKFRDHGHPSTGCDIIVCWRHNWNECPGHIEIVELSTVIKSLDNSDD
jgi:hypothetical protein